MVPSCRPPALALLLLLGHMTPSCHADSEYQPPPLVPMPLLSAREPVTDCSSSEKSLYRCAGHLTVMIVRVVGCICQAAALRRPVSLQGQSASVCTRSLRLSLIGERNSTQTLTWNVWLHPHISFSSKNLGGKNKIIHCFSAKPLKWSSDGEDEKLQQGAVVGGCGGESGMHLITLHDPVGPVPIDPIRNPTEPPLPDQW